MENANTGTFPAKQKIEIKDKSKICMQTSSDTFHQGGDCSCAL